MKNRQTHSIPFRRDKLHYTIAYFKGLYALMRMSHMGTIGAGSVIWTALLLPFAGPAVWRWRKFALFPRCSGKGLHF